MAIQVGGSSKLLLMEMGALVVAITLMIIFMKILPEKAEFILGELEIKESRRMVSTQKI